MEKMAILTEKEIEKALEYLRGWSFNRQENKITKEYTFPDFLTGLGFINKLADYFEKIDHHPDMHIFYNRIRFDLQRFDIGGKITERDIQTAVAIEKLYDQLDKMTFTDI